MKNPPANAGDVGSVPGSGRRPVEGNGNSLQYSSLEYAMDRGDWWVIVHGVTVRHDLVTKQQQHTFLQRYNNQKSVGLT